MVAWVAAAGAALKAAAPVIGKAAMAVAPSVLGGLFGGKSSSTTSYDGSSSKELMRYQDQLTREQSQWLNENSYTHMRTGLEKAGYNPLLAVGASPQTGSVGLGAPMLSNTANFSGAEAISSLLNMANIANVKANTDATLLGKLGQLLGTKYGNKVSGVIDGVLKSIQNTAKFNNKIEDAGTGVLKGYISNTSDFDYAPQYDELGKLPKELSRYH